MNERYCHIISGANGAGKTTFATNFLPQYAKCERYVNADLIAKGIAPFSSNKVSIAAGRLSLKIIRELMEKKKTFSFETTLSGKTYLNLFMELKKNKYKLCLYYLWIPNVEIAKKRIKERVNMGGHNVPIVDIERRYKRSLENFVKYSELMDLILFFDNSKDKPYLIFEKSNDMITVHNNKLFEEVKIWIQN